MTMNPILTWTMEKDRDGILRIRLKTTDKPMDQCFDKSYLYKYSMRDDLRKMEPYEEVRVYINSRGGDFRSFQGVYDALNGIRPWIPVRTLIEGECCSAATIFLGLRGHVYITPTGRIMIHKGSQTVYDEEGNAIEVKADGIMIDAAGELLAGSHRRAMRRNLGLIDYMKHRSMPRVWNAMHLQYFTPEEALELGLVRGIINAKGFENGLLALGERDKILAHRMKISAWTAVMIVLCILCGTCVGAWQYHEEKVNRKRIYSGTVIGNQFYPAATVMKEFRTQGMAGISQSAVPMTRGDKYTILVEADGEREVWVVSEDVYNRVEIGKKVRRSQGREGDG